MKAAPGGNPGGIMPPNVGVRPGKPSNQSAPKAGTRYNPPAAERAANRVETTPSSSSPSTYGNSWELTSRRPGPSGPFESTSDSDYTNAAWETPWARPKRKSNGKADTSGRFFK
jgi:hypothetical protein